jgi:hypothetical protein
LLGFSRVAVLARLGEDSFLLLVVKEIEEMEKEKRETGQNKKAGV